MKEALVPILGPSEVRRRTDELKRDADVLWQKLLALHDGGAHTALGYSSWGAYFEAEFGQSQRHGYRLLDAGRVLEAVSDQLVTRPTESQARELVPLLEQPEQLRETWTEVVDLHSEPTAENVRTAVEKRTARKPERSRSSASEKDFQKAVTDALEALGWRWCHSRPARTSKGWRTALSGDAGYPDITAVRRDRILFMELKSEKGPLSEEQGVWLADLGAAGVEAYCWRPSDWPAIEETLR